MLEVGADAGFVVFSPELEVRQTFVAGEEIFRSDKTTPAL